MFTKVRLSEITALMRNGVEGTRWGDSKIVAASQLYAVKVSESLISPESKRDLIYVLERIGTRRYLEIGRIINSESLKELANNLEEHAKKGNIPLTITLPFLKNNWLKGGKTSEEQGFGENDTEHDYAHSDTASWVGRFRDAAKGVPLPSAGSRRARGIIIDAGCSAGHSTAEIAKFYPHCDVIGIDASKEKILIAQENYPSLTFKLGNYLDLTSLFAANSIDIVIFGNNVSYHAGNAAGIAVAHAHTILKEGGMIIIYHENAYMLISHKQSRKFVNSIVWRDPSTKWKEWEKLPDTLFPLEIREKNNS